MGPFDSPFLNGEMNGLAGFMPEDDSGEYMAGWFSGQQMAEDDLNKTALDDEDDEKMMPSCNRAFSGEMHL